MLIPYALGGAVVGGGYYLFYYKFWTNGSSLSPMWDQITGYAVYGSILAACFIHPKVWWAGLYAGAAIGLLSYSLIYGNVFGNKSAVGYVTELPGLTEEERERQRERDMIHEFTLHNAINRRILTDL